jgi:hypothetical protein
METARVEVKPGARVWIPSVGGDLRLTGSESRRLEAQAGRHGGLKVKAREEGIELSSTGGCLVFLPSDCPVAVGTVGGDGRITDMEGELSVEAVGGDLRLRRLRQVSVDRVGGDVLGQRLRAGIRLGEVGGDGSLERVDGDVHIGSLGGDLRVRGLEGQIEAIVRGDVMLELSPRDSSSSSVHARGDVLCRVPAGASLKVRVHARGSERIDVSGPQEKVGEETTVVLGSGSASLALEAGGDVSLVKAFEAGHSELADSITAQVEAALEEAGVSAGMSPGEDSSLSRDVGDQVRRAVDRALRPAANRRAPVPPSGESDALAAEREMILKMLAEGRVTADEAEALFRAMEGGG